MVFTSWLNMVMVTTPKITIFNHMPRYGSTLQLVPRKDSSTVGGWTSGRLESQYIFTPQAGQVTRVEASIRLGNNPQWNKQGIWPAFWILGDSLRHGGSWPSCGEIDILESINGLATGYGTLHCDIIPGGVCNEGGGIGGSVNITNPNEFHTWRLEIDRTQTIGKWRLSHGFGTA